MQASEIEMSPLPTRAFQLSSFLGQGFQLVSQRFSGFGTGIVIGVLAVEW